MLNQEQKAENTSRKISLSVVGDATNLKAKATPLPWRIIDRTRITNGDEACAYAVGDLRGPANAQLIVHSVNTLPEVEKQRDALLEACKAALSDLASPERIHPRSRLTLSMATQQEIREAIALCEKGGQ